jgi:tripartite-type tricarboxylate transporter receptor subunit TctC
VRWPGGIAAGLLLVGAAAAPVAAQDYPQRAIKMVVPYAPGGGVDAAGRVLAQELSARLRQSVVVENRGGAGGVLGTQAVVSAPADGYTVLLVSAIAATSQSVMKNPPFDTMRDLKPVSLIASSPLILTVHPSVPVTDVSSLVAYARANPGKLNYASAGNGTMPHLAAELLSLHTGIRMAHVAYRGSGPAMTDLVAGRVQLAFTSIAAAQPHVAAAALRALATTGAKRSALLPSLPTVSESIPGVEVDLWIALFAPAGTPDDVVAVLNRSVRAALEAKVVREGFLRTGQEPTGSSPEGARAFVKAEIDKWAKVVEQAHIEAH